MELACECAVEMNEKNDDNNSILGYDLEEFFDADLFFTKNLDTKKKLSQEQRKQIWLEIGFFFYLAFKYILFIFYNISILNFKFLFYLFLNFKLI